MKRWLFLIFLLPLFLLSAKEAVPVSQPVVIFETNMGSFEITLKPEAAPKACENFLKLVAKGYYDGIIFHRVIKNFMIQGGDPTGTGRGGESIWGKPFADECKADVKFSKSGLLAMANRGPNTNGSQFFITTATTPWLHMKHTIFGEVTKGYEIVEKIEQTPTSVGDKPVQTVKIQRALIKNDALQEPSKDALQKE